MQFLYIGPDAGCCLPVSFLVPGRMLVFPGRTMGRVGRSGGCHSGTPPVAPPAAGPSNTNSRLGSLSSLVLQICPILALCSGSFLFLLLFLVRLVLLECLIIKLSPACFESHVVSQSCVMYRDAVPGHIKYQCQFVLLRGLIASHGAAEIHPFSNGIRFL